MGYFVRVGRIEENISKVGSRGYRIRREGKTVITAWGAIDVVDGEFFWRNGYDEKCFRHQSVQKATEFATSKKRILLKPGTTRGGYDSLPVGVIIRTRRPKRQ